MVLLSNLINTIKKWNPVSWDNVGGIGDHDAKWNKSAKERQVLCDLTHMWDLKQLIS
jgi:hypothetical protein